MAALGAAKTGKFAIGTAELRVGPLSLAGKLTRKHSVGLIDQATFTVDQTSVDLLGGFPQVIMDTQVVNQSAQVTATLREYSRRNLGIMLGQGLVYADSTDPVNDAMSGVGGTGTVAAGATSVTLLDGSNFATPDTVWDGWVTFYRPDNAGDSFIAKVATISGNAVTLETDFPTAGDMNLDTETWNMAKLAAIPMGNVSSVNYFTVQIITLDRQTGRPKFTNFWKAAVGSGMNWANNATDFASTDMTLKILQPALNDYEAVGSPLNHLSTIITNYPMGMAGEMSDNTADIYSNTVTTTTTGA